MTWTYFGIMRRDTGWIYSDIAGGCVGGGLARGHGGSRESMAVAAAAAVVLQRGRGGSG